MDRTRNERHLPLPRGRGDGVALLADDRLA
jgi:hypothetical protein